MALVRFRSALCVAALVTASAIPVRATAPEPLTIERIVAPSPALGLPPTDFRWAPDGLRYVYAQAIPVENAPPRLHVFDVATGRDTLLRAANTDARGSRSRAIDEIVWSPDSRHLAYVDGGDLRVAAVDGSDGISIAHGVDDPQWSPDGTQIAFASGNDLRVVDVRTKAARTLVRSRSEATIDGDPDWLYSEELDLAHAFAWSPGGDAIAYLRFDESAVTAFPIQDYSKPDNTVERQRYPLAGESNPRVSLHVVDLASATDRMLYDAAPHDEYIATFTWRPDGSSIVAQVLDRAQRHLRLLDVPRAGGAERVVLSEADARFVDASQAPTFLADGRRLLWISQRAGRPSLFIVDVDSTRVRRLTRDFPVASLLAFDGATGTAYVDARYPTRRDRALVAVATSGGGWHVLTPAAGTHTIAMAPRGGRFVDTFSTVADPPVIARRDARGGVRVLFRPASLARFALGTSRTFQIPSAWGPLDATLLLPPGFDPATKYPTIVDAYGGPLPASYRLPSDDAFPGLFPYLLAAHGYVVFTVDGPASRVDDARYARLYYHAAGEIALAGQLAGTDWLAKQSFVDPARIGLSGWSFGGYLTAFALTHAPATFKAGIAGAPVTDWRFYDTCYTERYMGSPRGDPAGYARNSVLRAAGRLRAGLLVVGGSSDDNVHIENSISLLDAFVRAGKQVDYFLYPGARHGVRGIAAQRHLDHKMLDFWERTL